MTAAALTIAGSDSGGGAGIQADLKTFAALGIYGTSAITALTAQNTCGVSAVHAPPPGFVSRQIDVVLDDFDIKAIKTGMLFSAEIAEQVAISLERAVEIPLILDPVMIATSGDLLIAHDAIDTIVKRLFPRAFCITPNRDEAAQLCGTTPALSSEEMIQQGKHLLSFGPKTVLMKGGHFPGEEALDILVTREEERRYSAKRIETNNTHGTGCTLSAAIAAYLAHGAELEGAIAQAKAYLSGALDAARLQRLGAGQGPVDHFHRFSFKGITP